MGAIRLPSSDKTFHHFLRTKRGTSRSAPNCPGSKKSHSSEFLQISSDCFRVTPWTFPEIGSMIALARGICSPVPQGVGEPGKRAVDNEGSSLIPQIPMKTTNTGQKSQSG